MVPLELQLQKRTNSTLSSAGPHLVQRCVKLRNHLALGCEESQVKLRIYESHIIHCFILSSGNDEHSYWTWPSRNREMFTFQKWCSIVIRVYQRVILLNHFKWMYSRKKRHCNRWILWTYDQTILVKNSHNSWSWVIRLLHDGSG